MPSFYYCYVHFRNILEVFATVPKNNNNKKKTKIEKKKKKVKPIGGVYATPLGSGQELGGMKVRGLPEEDTRAAVLGPQR